jgi:hypothetical protein
MAKKLIFGATGIIGIVGILLVSYIVLSSSSQALVSTPGVAPKETTAATTSSPTRLLGTKVGALALYLPDQDVVKMLGEPQIKTITPGLGTPRWEYSNGVAVEIAGSPGSKFPNAVWRITLTASSLQATEEGFRLGDTEEAFKRLYTGFEIKVCADCKYEQTYSHQLYITDVRGRSLNVSFNDKNLATVISLTNTRME